MTLNRGNKLFEGSRMVLPEHRKQIRNRDWEQANLVEPPILDEQQLENIQYTIMAAIEEKRKAEVFYYLDRRSFSRVGNITAIDAYTGMLKMEEENGGKALVPLRSISDVSLLD